MPIADLLQRLQEIPSVTVQPPAPHAERNVEGVAGAPLPADYRDLLEQCSAIDGLSIEVDFTGEAFDFGFEEAFPYKVTFAGDGIGNFWIADVAEPSADSPIFFACHDPPIVLFQCRGVETFLKELLKFGRKEPSSIEDVYEDRLYKVWSTNPGVISWKDAMADGALHDFALSLNMNYSFIDLREPSVGMGFSWGRYGPDTEVRRFDRQRIFAYAAPEKKPGLFSRLFGR